MGVLHTEFIVDDRLPEKLPGSIVTLILII